MQSIIGDNIRYLRKANNLSTQELADELGVSRSTICRWETGERNIAEDYFNDVCDYFEVTPEELELGVFRQ